MIVPVYLNWEQPLTILLRYLNQNGNSIEHCLMLLWIIHSESGRHAFKVLDPPICNFMPSPCLRFPLLLRVCLTHTRSDCLVKLAIAIVSLCNFIITKMFCKVRIKNDTVLDTSRPRPAHPNNVTTPDCNTKFISVGRAFELVGAIHTAKRTWLLNTAICAIHCDESLISLLPAFEAVLQTDLTRL